MSSVQNALPYWAVGFDHFDPLSMSVLHSTTMHRPNSAVDNIPKAMTTTNIVWPSDQGSNCGWRVDRVGRSVSYIISGFMKLVTGVTGANTGRFLSTPGCCSGSWVSDVWQYPGVGKHAVGSLLKNVAFILSLVKQL